ncbi:MAG TPA: GNAT family N-acetyltransferase [Acidimicrobiia bacterium]|nr:GNAT family N-acetyltransferase [Acidimicrobiia bacterium]
MPPIEVRPATHRDAPTLAPALARAFHDDPVMRWVFPSEAHRLRSGPRFWRSVVRQHLHHEGAKGWTTSDGAGLALWAAPDRWQPSFLTLLREAPHFAFALRHRIPRGVRCMTAIESHHPSEPHWYLAVLATDPPHQRRGVASTLLAPILEECDADGWPAYLETATEANVAFYRRHRFEVTGEITVPGGGPTVWLMWRDPR